MCFDPETGCTSFTFDENRCELNKAKSFFRYNTKTSADTKSVYIDADRVEIVNMTSKLSIVVVFTPRNVETRGRVLVFNKKARRMYMLLSEISKTCPTVGFIFK